MPHYRVTLPAYKRVEEVHMVSAGSEREALENALDGIPVEVVEDTDYYDTNADDARIEVWSADAQPGIVLDAYGEILALKATTLVAYARAGGVSDADTLLFARDLLTLLTTLTNEDK